MKVIKRAELLDRLKAHSGYWKKDLQNVLYALDEVIYECFDEVTPGEEVQIQLLDQMKLTGKWVPERERVDPRTQKPIVCSPTIKIGTVFGKGFRNKVQQQCDEKQKDD